MMPFSIEKLSVGRPAMFQSLIFTGSPRVPVTEKSSEQGMFAARQAFTQSVVCSCQHKVLQLTTSQTNSNSAKKNLACKSDDVFLTSGHVTSVARYRKTPDTDYRYFSSRT